MKFLDYESHSPYENIAIEELLLQPFIKTEPKEGLLRVWNNPKCVVIGRGEKIDQQVHLDQTEKNQIPVIRRVSGGGTVLHGPNNLNLSFFLPFHIASELKNLKASYQLILSWVQKALFESHKIQIDVNGSCDLVLEDRKISGTAQARKRYGILHHMTLLLNADYEGMESYLQEPQKRPDYRSQRTHRDFVVGLRDLYPDFDTTKFIESLKDILDANNEEQLSEDFIQKTKTLALEKYQSKQWNHEGKAP